MDSADLTEDYAITHGLITGLKQAGRSDAEIYGFLNALASRGEQKVALDLEGVVGTAGDIASKGVGLAQRAFTQENIKKYSPYVVSGLGAIMAREMLAPKRKMFGPRGLAAGALGGIAGGYLYNNWDTVAPRLNKAIDVAQASLAGTTESGNAAQ